MVKSLLSTLIAATFCAHAAAQDVWKPFAVDAIEAGKSSRIEFKPMDAAQKKWKLCVLVPHVKDSFFSAVDYGVVAEAKRMGVAMSLQQAGGYDALPKQVAQFDDCMSSGADAIVVAPISEAGLKNKFKQAADKGIPTVVFINPVAEAPVTAKIFVDFKSKGFQTGSYLRELMGAKGGNVVAFPGPQGSGWAESYLEGFKSSLQGSTVKVLDTKFGDAGVAEQLKLVEDSLQSFPDMNAIWGAAPAAEAAIGAVADAGAKDTLIVSSYENQTMLQAVNSGKIKGFATEFPVMQGRIAVNLAVAALEKKPFPSHLMVVPQMVTKESAAQLDITSVLAPQGFSPIFSVK